MNKAILQRFYHGEVTFGRLNFEWISSHPEIYTIELPWRDNETGISCIPQGLYNIIPHNTKAHPNSFRFLNVPNREGILFHPFNFASDVRFGKDWKHSESEGCIAPGFDYDLKVPMLKNSVKAMDWMREYIKGNWCVEIRNNFAPEGSIKWEI